MLKWSVPKGKSCMELLTIIILVILMGLCVLATSAGLPGNYGMMFVLAGIALRTGFTLISVELLTGLIALLILGEVVEFLAGYLSAKRQKAGWKAQLAALVGAIAGGSFGSGILPVVGSLIGVACGAYAGTYIMVYYDRRNGGDAKRIAMKVAVAQAIGTATKICISILVVSIVLYHWIHRVTAHPLIETLWGWIQGLPFF